MYLRGQMNLKSFLGVEILEMDPKYEVFTFDQIQYLGLEKPPDGITLQELKVCSLELKQKSDLPKTGLFCKFFLIIVILF